MIKSENEINDLHHETNIVVSIEPVREKTNNLGSNQVPHKLGCTVIEDGYRLEILDFDLL